MLSTSYIYISKKRLVYNIKIHALKTKHIILSHVNNLSP
ncbi:hypothetical protein P147_WWE3C00001G0569 [candidate division WWE3 bacterium RAAC2_WWE3_1]|nr:hypothetical protein P147_WWE3C00001G0569 [candidate division WWE3 bacterium RAAC2_WWE3_1]